MNVGSGGTLIVTNTTRRFAESMGVFKLFLTALLLLAPITEAQEEETGWDLRVCASEDNLPYSNRQLQGFENRVAEIVANELRARLVYIWLPQPHHPEYALMQLREGVCDLFMGVLDGQRPFLTTLAYYRSTNVFVYRKDAPYEVQSLDDAVLRTLHIGVLRGSPPDSALANRGIIANVRHYLANDSLSAIIDAVIADEIDVGIAWGPIAGYFSKQQPVSLELSPVTPEVDFPFNPMVLSISMGVREQDEALCDQLNMAISRRWKEIQAVLTEYGVPLLPLSQPVVSVGGS
jgi:mxaJ protein